MYDEATRLERVARFRAKDRERNRQAGIPDMELGDAHDPAEYFAQVGYHWLLDRIGRSDPDYDWSEEGGDDDDRQKFLAARRLDHQRVADWLRAAEVKDHPHCHGCKIGDVRIAWADRVPALKTWAGQQTLAKLVKIRQKALPKKVEDVLACKAPIRGSSGLYKPCATTALEDGFSVDVLGMDRVTPVGMELLAIIGLETLTITVYPDGTLGYDADDSRWVFRIENRNDYYGRWGMAERVR